MTHVPAYIATLKVPVKRTYGTGRFLTVILDSVLGPQVCAGSLNNCRTTSAESAPLQSGLLRTPEPAQNAPVPTPTGAGLSHAVPVPLVALSPTGAKKQPKTTPHEDLSLAQNAMSDLSADLAVLDDELGPVRIKERAIRDAILATHDRDERGVVILDLIDRRERRRLFEELNQIGDEWGTKKAARKNLHTRIKSLEKQIQHLEKIISKERKRA